MDSMSVEYVYDLHLVSNCFFYFIFVKFEAHYMILLQKYVCWIKRGVGESGYWSLLCILISDLQNSQNICSLISCLYNIHYSITIILSPFVRLKFWWNSGKVPLSMETIPPLIYLPCICNINEYQAICKILCSRMSDIELIQIQNLKCCNTPTIIRVFKPTSQHMLHLWYLTPFQYNKLKTKYSFRRIGFAHTQLDKVIFTCLDLWVVTVITTCNTCAINGNLDEP